MSHEKSVAGRPYLPGIEAARGAAALLVLLYHAAYRLLDTAHFSFEPIAFVDWFSFGARGVDLFFVLSGFIIFHAHRADLGRPDCIAAYGVRRLLRIYPVYWAVLAVVVLGIVQPSGAPDAYAFPKVLHSVLLAPVPDYPIVDAAWTLRHEMLFYMLFAVLILSRTVGIAVLGAWLSGILAAAFFNPAFPYSFLLSPYNAEFFAGIAVALAASRWRIRWPRRVALLGGALFLASGVLYDIVDSLTEWECIAMFALPSALIVAGLAQLEQGAAIPRSARFTGRISYPLYIVQPIAMPAIAATLAVLHLDDMGPAAVVLVLAAGSIASAIVLHRLIERPFQALSGRAVARLKGHAALRASA